MEILKLLWTTAWLYGWTGFIGLLAYTITGTIVFFNTVNSSAFQHGEIKFFRYLVFCALCGPIGWIAFSFYLTYKVFCVFDLVDIQALAEWLVGKKVN